MNSRKIRVGIVGANPHRGWAMHAHIPALMSSPDFEITAVSSTRMESASEVARKHNVPNAFDNHTDLVDAPDIDLVVVTVKVPHHHEIVIAALNAGKHVFCEWPLGNGLKEAEGMAALAKTQNLHGFVGLQARCAPVVNQVKRLVADGFVGDVLSSSVVASGRGWGASVLPASMYLLDEANGATMLTIPAGHFIDAFCFCLGEFKSFNATRAARRKSVPIEGESNKTVAMKTADQLVLGGTLESGAIASIHFRGGTNRSTNLLWEINGTDGDLLVTGDSGHIQMIDLTLTGARDQDKAMKPIEIEPKFSYVPPSTPPGNPFNVAQLYAQIAKCLKAEPNSAPTFDDAVRRHEMLQRVQQLAPIEA